jgi:hypothetical protein
MNPRRGGCMGKGSQGLHKEITCFDVFPANKTHGVEASRKAVTRHTYLGNLQHIMLLGIC